MFARGAAFAKAKLRGGSTAVPLHYALACPVDAKYAGCFCHGGSVVSEHLPHTCWKFCAGEAAMLGATFMLPRWPHDVHDLDGGLSAVIELGIGVVHCLVWIRGKARCQKQLNHAPHFTLAPWAPCRHVMCSRLCSLLLIKRCVEPPPGQKVHFSGNRSLLEYNRTVKYSSTAAALKLPNRLHAKRKGRSALLPSLSSSVCFRKRLQAPFWHKHWLSFVVATITMLEQFQRFPIRIESVFVSDVVSWLSSWSWSQSQY